MSRSDGAAFLVQGEEAKLGFFSFFMQNNVI